LRDWRRENPEEPEALALHKQERANAETTGTGQEHEAHLPRAARDDIKIRHAFVLVTIVEDIDNAD